MKVDQEDCYGASIPVVEPYARVSPIDFFSIIMSGLDNRRYRGDTDYYIDIRLACVPACRPTRGLDGDLPCSLALTRAGNQMVGGFGYVIGYLASSALWSGGLREIGGLTPEGVVVSLASIPPTDRVDRADSAKPLGKGA
ncbi:hypothetical protein RRG08_054949 [Elysia crispata]|uniref:Uncharacterized protein n=1 Tax=Elysia crispata TaxID=231223 RepID=A0AAE0YY27_9GAST|nr:hypothetical protein RRG08_054949 [Elysia crispata]